MGEKLVESMDFNGKGVDTVVRAVALSGGAESGGDAVQRPGRLDGRFLGGGGCQGWCCCGQRSGAVWRGSVPGGERSDTLRF